MPGYPRFGQWIVSRRWPLEYGDDTTTRLKNRLEEEGFARVRVQTNDVHPVWQVRMGRGTYQGELSRQGLRRCIRQVAFDIGHDLDREVIISVRGERVYISAMLQKFGTA